MGAAPASASLRFSPSSPPAHAEPSISVKRHRSGFNHTEKTTVKVDFTVHILLSEQEHERHIYTGAFWPLPHKFEQGTLPEARIQETGWRQQ